jgi:hypothetical protein
MTQEEKIKKYDLTLHKYIQNKSFVKILRTIFGNEENLSGFILGMSSDFLFLQLGSDFMFDGYAIIRKEDFDSIRHSSYERTQRKIFNAEGLLAKAYGFSRELPLTSWAEIFETLKDYDFHIIIENTNNDHLDFWIGPITKVTNKKVSLLNYNPNGQLYKKPDMIMFDTIRTVKFGDRYSTIFRKYLKTNEKKEKLPPAKAKH